MTRNEADTQVAFLLLGVFDATRADVNAKRGFNIGLSQEETAEYLGLRVEAVTRKLTDLSDFGYIKVKGSRVRACDCDGLRELCGCCTILWTHFGAEGRRL